MFIIIKIVFNIQISPKSYFPPLPFKFFFQLALHPPPRLIYESFLNVSSCSIGLKVKLKVNGDFFCSPMYGQRLLFLFVSRFNSSVFLFKLLGKYLEFVTEKCPPFQRLFKYVKPNIQKDCPRNTLISDTCRMVLKIYKSLVII